jgi:hypothetical protein
MVVLVDLDDDEPSYEDHSGLLKAKPLHHSLAEDVQSVPVVGDERPNPNINGFSAALSCYP